MRPARTVALLGLLLALSGCALLASDEPPRSQPPQGELAAQEQRPGGEPPPPPPESEGLTIEAPPQLRDLLLRNLDLARLAALSGAEAPDETEWLRLVAAAPAQVRELLETEGYFHPQIKVERERGPPSVVHVHVVPGPRARIREVMLSLQGVVRERADAGDEAAREQIRELHAWWPLPPGDTFRNPDWSAAKREALSRLRAGGYAAATITSSAAQVNADNDQVQLTLTLDSGPLFLAGELHIVGLQLHDEAAVRHLAGFGPGAPLTAQTLLDYQERLRKANLYDSIVVSFDSDIAKAGASPVTVTLHELPLQSLTLGVGISANNGPRATAEHTHRRILGYSATLHNKIEWGRDRQAWEGELSSHPGERFYRNMIGVQLENQITDVDEVLSARMRLGRTQDTNRIERLYFLGLDRSVQTVGTLEKEAKAVSAQYHGIWRDLDSVILPTRGITISGQGGVGYATSNYADKGPFTLLYGKVTGYLPLGTSWYTTARLEVGQIFKHDNVAVPDTLAFRAGGDESVRGYDYRTLAPIGDDGAIIGGNVLATASVEVARPFAQMPSVWWAVFVDAGRAAEGWKGFKPALGYGVGVRWRSPVGPLRADLAYGEELRQVRLHVSVGIAF
ncbi:MAG TPA: BamA/TamA family outer membrane protein [Burkholderiaceae bacterium]